MSCVGFCPKNKVFVGEKELPGKCCANEKKRSIRLEADIPSSIEGGRKS